VSTLIHMLAVGYTLVVTRVVGNKISIVGFDVIRLTSIFKLRTEIGLFDLGID